MLDEGPHCGSDEIPKMMNLEYKKLPYLVIHYIYVRVTVQELERITTKGENFRGVGSPLKDFMHIGGIFECYE